MPGGSLGLPPSGAFSLSCAGMIRGVKTMFKKQDWSTGLVALVMGIFVLYNSLPLNASVKQAQKMSDVAGPSGLPNIIGAAMVIIGLIYLGASFLIKEDGVKAPVAKKTKTPEKGNDRWVILLVVIISSVYIVLLPILGYLLMTPLLMASLLWLFRERRWLNVIAISVVFTALLYVIFNNLLKVYLPVMFG